MGVLHHIDNGNEAIRRARIMDAIARTAQPFAPGEHGRADPLSSAPVTFDDRVHAATANGKVIQDHA